MLVHTVRIIDRNSFSFSRVKRDTCQGAFQNFNQGVSPASKVARPQRSQFKGVTDQRFEERIELGCRPDHDEEMPAIDRGDLAFGSPAVDHLRMACGDGALSRPFRASAMEATAELLPPFLTKPEPS